MQAARTGRSTQNEPPPPHTLLGGGGGGMNCYSRGSNPGAGLVCTRSSGGVWTMFGLVRDPCGEDTRGEDTRGEDTRRAYISHTLR